MFDFCVAFLVRWSKSEGAQVISGPRTDERLIVARADVTFASVASLLHCTASQAASGKQPAAEGELSHC
jgi:hypothetical protein